MKNIFAVRILVPSFLMTGAVWKAASVEWQKRCEQ
jgi:hypothetical protein